MQKEVLIELLFNVIDALERDAVSPGIVRRLFYEEEIGSLIASKIGRRLSELDSKIETLLSRPPTTCRIGTQDGSGVIELMTGVGSEARSGALRHLSGILDGAKNLAICDPYFRLAYRHLSKPAYVSQIDGVLPKTLQSIELFVKPHFRDAEVATGFTKLCRARGIRLTCRTTDEIHDRVWIADWCRAYVVGTSFNGLGNKCAFILELSAEDCRNFIQELTQIRERTNRSTSA